MNIQETMDALLEAIREGSEPVSEMSLFSHATIGDNAVYIGATLRYENDSELDVHFVVFDDGTWFSPWDWQGHIPKIPSELNEITWQLGLTGRKAVIMDGLPRMLTT